MLPRISIITPSYQQAPYLEACLASVREQGYSNLEHIVVDGGSSDGSKEILERNSAALAWWCSEQDRGQSHAINKGATHATGTVFAWLNSDDLLLPGTLHRVGEAFAKDPTMTVFCGARVVRSVNGDRVLPAEDVSRPEGLFTEPMVNQQATFYRMDVVRKAGFVDEALHYVMDLELWLRVLFAEGTGGLRSTAEPLAVFREHATSKTSLEQTRFVHETAGLLHGLCLATGQADLASVLAIGHRWPGTMRGISLLDPTQHSARVRAMVLAFLFKWHHRIWSEADLRMMKAFRSRIALTDEELHGERRTKLAELDEQLAVPGWWAFRLRRKWQHLWA